MSWNDRQAGGPQRGGGDSGDARPVNTNLIRPFYIKKTEDESNPIRATIIFLDDVWFEFLAHRPVINGKRSREIYACMQGVWEEDTRCVYDLFGGRGDVYSKRDDDGDDPFRVKTCTVVEEWTPPGKETRYYRKPFAVRISDKEDSYDILKKEQDLRGGLAGCRFSVVRTKGYATCGNQFSFLGKEEMKEHYGKKVLADPKFWWTSPRGKTYAKEPLDYMKVFRPLRHNEAAELLGISWPSGEPLQEQAPPDDPPPPSDTAPPEGAPEAPERATPDDRTKVWMAYCQYKGWDTVRPPENAQGDFYDWVHMVTGLEAMRNKLNWTKDTVAMLLDDVASLQARAKATDEISLV